MNQSTRHGFRSRSPVRSFLLSLCGLLLAGTAQALTVTAFSPQGEVARVRQVVAKFDQDAVRLGSPGAPAPFTLQCDHPAAAGGQGHWVNARQWVHDFRTDLPPGVRCQALPVAGFRTPGGAALSGPAHFSFSTGGPFLQGIEPGSWKQIEEEQVFVLQLSGAATPESVQANVWCALDGVGERVPVRLLEGAPRAALLKEMLLEGFDANQPGRVQVLQCTRRFTPESQVQIVYGRGVATPSGIASKTEQRTTYKVREPFTASTSCERENAQAACMPVRPIELAFSAPVPRRWLDQVRLRSDSVEHAPGFDEDTPPDALLDRVVFKGPFAERSRFTLSLPPGLQDASDRPLANAASFPLTLATGPLPPLAKFASAPFGIVERFAEGPGGPALLPLTLRRVEPRLQANGLRLGDLQPQGDAEIIEWFTKVQRYDNWLVPRKQAQIDLKHPLPRPVGPNTKDSIESRTVSLLAGNSGTKTIEVPPAPAGNERPFEVVGIPLSPGFHVLEVSSGRLGQSLLDPAYGADRPMVVRTSVLVTNLAVHFKLGRENALAWVTTLDKGQPVAGAAVQVSDCRGRPVARAQTDARGIATLKDIPTHAPDCNREGDEYLGDFQSAWFVSARAENNGAPDMAFTWSSWQRGIESWRFGVPTRSDPASEVRAHTVFDRTLLRAGETVSMKHLIRTETGSGFGLPKDSPDQLVITHRGSGQEYRLPLHWRSTASGGRSAESEFAIPPSARLGFYDVSLQRQISKHHHDRLDSGQFRVEEFRLPALQGRVGPAGNAPLVAVERIPVQVQVHYVNGGPAAGLPVRMSTLTTSFTPSFGDFEAFSFDAPRKAGDNEADTNAGPLLLADRVPVTLDREGLGQVTILDPKLKSGPRQLVTEATYADPNGELQTLRGTRTLWPAGVVAGIKAERWASVSQSAQVQVLALDLDGKPKAGVPLDVRAIARTTTSTRKRMVGSFYAYENHTDTTDLGTVCTGTSDARGQLACKVKLAHSGEVELIASARDDKGHTSLAATSIWITHQGELWFGGNNDDRMDVLAEKKTWQPGETARLQVRMPFRRATALLTVEREGILHTEVLELRGDDPTLQLKIQDGWGPNVYVSVLALRGRVHEVPWYSFFTWGYQAPREWWQAFWHDSKDFAPATALVDLSKPAFRLGMAELKVGAKAHELAVEVKTDRASYPVRGKAQVSIRVRKPDGQPAAHAEVALAAVDQALLELMPNHSWDLLAAMLQRRAWGVETATAQMEIIGRRHYGRKAVPAGGDGGASPTRELLDTLLLWQPRLQLDAQGQARIEVPLNDALTSFRIVAVADLGNSLFGTGQATIRTTQDLQIIGGLPPLVREGDAFTAMLTLRNTTARAMKVEVRPRATLLELGPQTVELPAGQARELHWPVAAPEQLAFTRVQALLWEVDAREVGGSARDRLKLSQRIVPAVPITVRQASLVQLGEPLHVEVAPPADALPGSNGAARGGFKLSLQPRLADGLPAIRDWFERYPYSCLEQQTSKAIGMDDHQAWQRTVAALPAYLDGDGLASYFPPSSDQASQGSDTLTAWLLAATHEAGQLDPAWRLPDEARQRMIAGLTAFVEGRLERKFWSPRNDLDVRKLAAIEALSRHNAASASMLASIAIAPNQWPTSAVLDWASVLRRVPGIAEQPRKLAEAMQVLRARISVQGTRLVFANEQNDAWWWLMTGGDVNAARLLLMVMQDHAWKDELGQLITGFIARQSGGTWNTTTANLWGSLALRQFSRTHESQAVAGITRATLAGSSTQVDWRQVKALRPGEPTAGERFFGAPAQPGQLTGNTMQLPWPARKAAQLDVTHAGDGKPWLTLQSLAAVELKAPFAAGYAIRKTVTPIEQANKSLPAGQHTRGDILRVRLEVQASTPMTWVAITDPIPAGATILGSGLGRDSGIATQGEQREGYAWPAFEERSFEALRSYYRYLPKGTMSMEYTLRLNNAGRFQLPPTRVEAIYAPEMFGEAPNRPVEVRMP